ncbi:MAG TPA: hypothetical protein VM223_19460 [Planctomycetota bacterium]|nr:hypothetical protein [Planctomycetota bacterium]
MARTRKKILTLAAGGLLLGLAALGGLIPIVQGWPFFLVGLALLCKESKTARRFDQWLRRKLPRVFALTDHLKDEILKVLRRSKGIKDALSHLLHLVFRRKTPPPAASVKKTTAPEETTALP